MDNVNRPDHYTEGGIETIDFIKAKMTEEQFFGYCLGNVMKYVSRCQFKNDGEDIVNDLHKAEIYLIKAIKELV